MTNYDHDDFTRALVRGADGSIVLIDVPGYLNTEPGSINASGVIAGYCSSSASTTVGFIYTP